MAATMTAGCAHTRGGPDVLIYEDALRPQLRSGDALVHVCAAAITPTGLSATWETHTRAKSAAICAIVLEGATRCQIDDGRVATHKAGKSFSELPGDRHGVSANDSKTMPATLLAVFVVDTNETELTIPFARPTTSQRSQGGDR